MQRAFYKAALKICNFQKNGARLNIRRFPRELVQLLYANSKLYSTINCTKSININKT